jgi:hypothetical protein
MYPVLGARDACTRVEATVLEYPSIVGGRAAPFVVVHKLVIHGVTIP